MNTQIVNMVVGYKSKVKSSSFISYETEQKFNDFISDITSEFSNQQNVCLDSNIYLENLNKEEDINLINVIVDHFDEEEMKALIDNFEALSQLFYTNIPFDYYVPKGNTFNIDIKSSDKIVQMLNNDVKNSIVKDVFNNIIKGFVSESDIRQILEFSLLQSNKKSNFNNSKFDLNLSNYNKFIDETDLKVKTVYNFSTSESFLDNKNIENLPFLIKKEISENIKPKADYDDINVDDIDTYVKNNKVFLDKGIFDFNVNLEKKEPNFKQFKDIYTYENEIVDQVKKSLHNNIKSKSEGLLTLNLKPEGLGELKINFVKTVLGVSVEIITNSKDVKNVLLNQIQTLNNGLTSLGNENLKISVVETFNTSQNSYNQSFSENSNYQSGEQKNSSNSEQSHKHDSYNYRLDEMENIDFLNNQKLFDNQNIDVYI